MPKQPLALIDFNAGRPNRGKANILAVTEELGYEPVLFDLRLNNDIPNIADFDVFVSTGGPGDPSDTGNWGETYRQFVNNLMEYNKNNPENPKYYFAICHSFQVLSEDVLKIGKSSMRDNKLTGIHSQKTVYEDLPPLLASLPEHFNTLENRFYQILLIDTHPDFVPFAMADEYLTGLTSRDGTILATQFHPEATTQSVTEMLNDPEQEQLVREIHGEQALLHMKNSIGTLETGHNLFRNFLKQALHAS